MAATGDDQSAPPDFDLENLPPLLCIAGAPRCGTTSLAEFLRVHPEVCFSRIKEPHFFSRFDLGHLGGRELRSTIHDSYLERFFRWKGRGHVLAEGSVSYLYAAERMRPLLRVWPDAKFIVMLRDPLEMLPSLHQRLLYLGDETEKDFGKAWQLRSERATGRQIPRSCVDPRLLRYDEIGRLGKHLSDFLEVVGRRRCLVILHEDFAADPAAAYRLVQRFVGLTPVHPPEQTVHRQSVGYRIGWLQRLMYRPPLITRAILRRANKADAVIAVRNAKSLPIGRAARKLRRRLVSWNRVTAPPSPISSEIRRQICELLADDIAQLSVLIDRDLDHWLNGAVAARMPLFRKVTARRRAG